MNAIGGNLNAQIDFIHDTDHGVRVCNNEKEENDHGVCFTAGKCSALGGHPGGGGCVAPTPKTTCCKFERTCGEISAETVTYFKVNLAFFYLLNFV